MGVRRVNTEMGRRSLFLRRPILWNGLNVNNETRSQDDVARFKVALHVKKCNLEQISFMKGTCVNLNKNLDDFFYYQFLIFNLRCCEDNDNFSITYIVVIVCCIVTFISVQL